MQVWRPSILEPVKEKKEKKRNIPSPQRNKIVVLVVCTVQYCCLYFIHSCQCFVWAFPSLSPQGHLTPVLKVCQKWISLEKSVSKYVLGSCLKWVNRAAFSYVRCLILIKQYLHFIYVKWSSALSNMQSNYILRLFSEVTFALWPKQHVGLGSLSFHETFLEKHSWLTTENAFFVELGIRKVVKEQRDFTWSHEKSARPK